MPIEVYNEHSNFQFIDKPSLEYFLLDVFRLEGVDKDIELNIILLSDEDLLEYNEKYLNHDYYTDIITFLIEESEEYLEAELYISVDRVQDNAMMLKQALDRELLRVFIHGVLHLCSYRDKSSEEEQIMREKENFYLELSDVSRETLFSLS